VDVSDWMGEVGVWGSIPFLSSMVTVSLAHFIRNLDSYISFLIIEESVVHKRSNRGSNRGRA
jgi:hypothetical protein